MSSESTPPPSLIDKAGKTIIVLRDAFLLLLLLIIVPLILPDLLPKLRAAVRGADVESVNFGVLTLKLARTPVSDYSAPTITVAALEGPAAVIDKGSFALLQQLENQTKRIDAIGFKTDGTYSGELILAYIQRLSPRIMAFRDGERLVKWIEPSILAAQIQDQSHEYSYGELLSSLKGLHSEYVIDSASVKDALGRMSDAHVSRLPVVDSNGRILSVVDRDELISKVITDVILKDGASPRAPKRV